MTGTFARLVTATALVAVACVEAPPAGRSDEPVARLETIAQALAIRDTDPTRAAHLLASAGPGAALETLRQELWFAALERSGAGPEGWQALVDARPAPSVARRARLGLAAALLDAGRAGEAVAVLESAPGEDRSAVDLLRLRLGGPGAAAAARRLAVAEPVLLERQDRGLARQAAESLEPRERLERARRWRELGAPSRAATELRQGRWPTALERARRLELGRAELERGASSRALAAVPASADLSLDERVLRAAAYRAQGWGRFPDSSSSRHFGDCVESARPLLATAPAAAAPWREGQQLLLECATETGELETAVAAWRNLESSGWTDSRRGWLGRRLGVALAVAGRPEARLIAAALPEHERCIAYWRARSDPDAARRLARWRELASTPVADLYGGWARRRLELPPAPAPSFPPDVLPAAPPSPSAWLLERGEPALGLDEWRRLREVRGVSPGEAVAAAELAARLGRRNDVITWLRAAFPEVAGTELGTVPLNVVRAYLPLDWQGELVASARAQGLPPSLVAAVARQESTFNPRARSSAGAVGLLQLMTGTARGHARALGLGLRPDLTDPAVNLALGSRELATLIGRFGAVEPALAAYNAGETRARRWWRRWPDREEFVEAIPIPETYTYVRRVVFLAEAYRVTYPTLREGEP